MKIVTAPLAYLYEKIIRAKNRQFDREIQAQSERIVKVSVPVVSIGNLTVGGTGKTPITDYLLKKLYAARIRVAVVCRSYGGQVQDPEKVDLTKSFAAQYYGDEPVLLATLNPHVDVFCGRVKSAIAKFAVQAGSYDLIIVDDGFQHRQLHRDWDIVLLDATDTVAKYECLPLGRAREPISSLARAQQLVITKRNLASPEFKQVLDLLPEKTPVSEFDYEISHCQLLQGEGQLTREHMKGMKFFLVSAIGRPDVFKNMLAQLGEVSEKSHYYRDHHQYKRTDIQKIMKDFVDSGADFLITTEKDGVKLQNLLRKTDQVWTAVLTVRDLDPQESMYESILKIIR